MLAFFACNAFENENPVLMELQGDWSLNEIRGGWFGETVKMDTANYTVDLNIINNQVSWYQNNNLQHRYSITSKKESETGLMLLPIEDNTDLVRLSLIIFSINADSLELYPDCTDCSSYLFVKERN